LSYRVYTPPKSFWFGTEFPVVEGTELLSGKVHLPNGNQVISMILPIRGQYRVKTTVRGPHGKSNNSTTFSVPENPQEIINLSVFLLVLFLIGGIGGYFLTGERSATPSSLLLLAFVAGGTLVLSAPESAKAHGQGEWDPHTLESQKGVMTLDKDVILSVQTFPEPVDVGEMLKVNYDVDFEEKGHHDETSHPHSGHAHGMRKSKKLVLAESHFVHSAGGLEMVQQTSWLDDGEAEINVQLFDGAPHYLVTRFYRPTEIYRPDRGHDHDHGAKSSSSRNGSDESDHDNHAHGESDNQGNHGDHEAMKRHDKEPIEPSWEAEMLYHLEKGVYTVTFEESSDPAMKWFMIPQGTDHPREAAVEAMESCRSINPGTEFQGSDRCYNLTLNEKKTSYELRLETGGKYHLFTQHLPREFDMTVKANGEVLSPERKYVKGKGEFLGRSVNWIELNAVQPPFDDIFKSMVTLLGVIAMGFFVGYKSPGWMA
jgi:hypothetical protein